MTRGFSRAALLAAGFTAIMAGGTGANAAVTSFGGALTISSTRVAASSPDLISATRIIGNQEPAPSIELATPLFDVPVAFGSGKPLAGFAASVALSSSLALDIGRNFDVAGRFDNMSGLYSPLVSEASAPYLALADGGDYIGATWMAASGVRLRVGAASVSDPAGFSFDPASANGAMPSFGARSDHTLLAGASWGFAPWGSLDVTAAQNSRFGLDRSARLLAPAQVNSNTLDVSAHIGLGAGWEASYSESLSQHDLRYSAAASSAEDLSTHSYSIAIAKHGLFGDDALGLSFGRSPAGFFDNGLTAITAVGEMSPVLLRPSNIAGSGTPETDIQLGYVTTFLNGALAVQTNAAYEMNVEGQTGTSAVSLLSRAKIKF